MFDDYRPKDSRPMTLRERATVAVFVIGFPIAVFVSVLIMNYTRGM